MTSTIDGPDMELSSGIAAFESKQFTTATRMLAPLAEQGNAEAQYRMAIMAQNGLGMVENQLLAYRYMKEAAEAGMGLAQHGLGFMFMQGECVEQNAAKALEWFSRAADQGLQGAMTTIGMTPITWPMVSRIIRIGAKAAIVVVIAARTGMTIRPAPFSAAS